MCLFPSAPLQTSTSSLNILRSTSTLLYHILAAHMGFCYKCTMTIAAIAVLLAIGPYVYQNIDQREYNRRTTAEEAAIPNNFEGKTIIVTGASSGIGIPTAKVLFENGASVVMACRNESKANKARDDILSQINNQNLDDAKLKVLKLDLASLQSIDSFVDSVTSSYDSLNIVINNAGIMGIDEYTVSEDGIESQFATNNLGHFYLTQQLTPLLIKSSSSSAISRVINTASLAYTFAPINIKSWLVSPDKLGDKSQYIPMQRYGLTKAINIIYAKEYNKRYSSKGVYSASLHPGVIKTGLQLSNFWWGLWNQFVPGIGAKTPSQGAATQIRLAAMSDEQFIANGGAYFEDCNPAKVIRTDVNSEELGTLLWDLCGTFIKAKAQNFYGI
eukprot:856981_1